MRISVTGFARIRDDQGRYCLLVNKGRLARGTGRILSPIGGGLEVDQKGLEYLKSLGATSFESLPDLRFRISDDQVFQVLIWFGQRIDREISVLRELREELGKETGILTADELKGITEELVAVQRYDALTVRDVPEKKTAYLIEVFDTTVPARVMQKLLAAATLPVSHRWVYFVTQGEIENGETCDGVEIGPICRTIL